MDGIIRNPTEAERDLTPVSTDGDTRGFVPIVGGRRTTQDDFNQKLAEEMSKAHAKGLPFCDRAAKDEFKEAYDIQAKKSMRQHGYVRPEDIKPVEMNWSKYSDLKNFEIIEEGETADEYLTKTNPGLNVFCKKTIYRFKGYSNKYTMMEDGPSAIRRARAKLKELDEATTKKK